MFSSFSQVLIGIYVGGGSFWWSIVVTAILYLRLKNQKKLPTFRNAKFYHQPSLRICFSKKNLQVLSKVIFFLRCMSWTWRYLQDDILFSRQSLNLTLTRPLRRKLWMRWFFDDFYIKICFESDVFIAYPSEWDWRGKNDIYSH